MDRVKRSHKLTPRELWKRECPLFKGRVERHLTQAEVAKAIGKKQPQISDAEHARGPLDPDLATRLARLFNVDGQEFYTQMLGWAALEPRVSEREKLLAARRVIRKHSPIKKRAMELEITLSQLADVSGLALATIYNYAHDPGYEGVKLRLLDTIAYRLGLDFVTLAADMLEWQKAFDGKDHDDVLVQGMIYEEERARHGRG